MMDLEFLRVFLRIVFVIEKGLYIYIFGFCYVLKNLFFDFLDTGDNIFFICLVSLNCFLLFGSIRMVIY